YVSQFLKTLPRITAIELVVHSLIESGFEKDCSYDMAKDILNHQIVSSGPDISELDEIKYGYLKMIQKARKYIYIQSPYLILDST
ncbi:hypothetical protein ACTPEM_24125, partial [Clostridioides difficile]